MSDPTFKQLPSISAVEKRVRELHQMVGELAQAIGTEVSQLAEAVKQNNALTDQVLDELSLQIAFVMQKLTLSKPLHGGIADANGKVPLEVKTFSEVYAESGRNKLLQQRKEFRDAHGLPTAESAPEGSAEAANGQTTDAQDANVSQADLGPVSKLITH